MTGVTRDDVLDALSQVKGPDLKGDIVSMGLVSDLLVSDGKVIFSVKVPAERAQELEGMRLAAEKVVKAIPGVQSVMAAMTAERKPGSAAQKSAAQAPKAPGGGRGKAGIPGVGAIIAVASGKGGVGKSTTSVNLALGLQANGLRVGILDADIYGPSMPKLLGLKGRPDTIDGKIMKPMNGYGLSVMSIGFMVDEETAMIWRGPMVMSALTQMMREVAWGELDVLIVDMPPGTGDAQLTMAQQVPLAGAVVVSTPQDLALLDARRGIAMFEKTGIPVLGLVENMSYFLCPSCGERSDIFGHGGARAEAGKMGAPFLGEVPLHMDIRAFSDAGTPIVATEPDSQHAVIYKDIAKALWDRHLTVSGQASAPKIVFE
ncbi:iron-sulfur cluster carrier protein ApbC [Coralliovum pocilloporae]|uniref:iron-sulfur cluster carrier protein ApbC n=1 Tax=Coralliovum pocilloporae TaxID=3066369 RepID=UPI0033076844